jgi:transcription elongation factor GreA
MIYDWKHTIFLASDPEVDAAVAAKLDLQVRTLLEANNAQAVEDLLLARINETPLDLPFFIPVFRNFIKNKQTDLAETYLDLLIEEYRGPNVADAEIRLARALLHAWPESVKARRILIERLRTLYPDSPNFKRLEAHCNVMESIEPLSAFKLFENWLRFDEGRGVYLASRGVGRVREINLAVTAVRVTFPESNTSLSFKPDEALRLLEPLNPGHFLLDKLERLPELQKCAESDGGALLHRLFASINRPLPLAELREMLSGIVPVSSWSSWWTQARKDRRLTVGANNICSWNDSAEDADSAILRQFMAVSGRDKLEMARKHAKRSPTLASAMASELLTIAEAESQSNPALALELLLAIERLSAETPATLKKDLATLIGRTDVVNLIQEIGDRNLRKRTLTLIREQREDWPAVYLVLVKTESDASSLATMYDSLHESHAAMLDDLVREIMSSPTKAPFLFVWLCRELPSRKELIPFANWNFLQLVLELLGKDVIKEHNAALRKLFDEDEAVYVAARKLDPAQAVQFITILDRDSTLEDYRRANLLRDVRAWFPHTQEEPEHTTFFVSREALSLRQDEFTKLTTVEIPRNTEEIVKARAHGDLRENFEYHAARTRQEMLSSRAKTLHDELQFARPIDPSNVEVSAVSVGTSVRLAQVEGSGEVTVTVLGPWDSDPAIDILSYLAPAGNALLGKRKGDQVTFNEKPFRVVDITVYNPGSKA